MAIASADTALSSTFSINAIFAAATGTVTITNPGRSFRILGVTGVGTAASVITVRKNTGAGVTAAVVTIDVTGETMWGALTTTALEFAGPVIDPATSVVTPADNIHITVATQNATQCDILCVETGGGTTLSNAVT